MDQLLIKKNNNVSNVGSNTSTTPMPIHDQVEACSMNINHQNIVERKMCQLIWPAVLVKVLTVILNLLLKHLRTTFPA